MTENNLGVHLRWLLNCGSLQPPQPTYAPPPIESSIAPEDAHLLAQTLDDTCADAEDEELCSTTNNRSHIRPHDIARVQQSASRINARINDAMAKLQSGPKTSNKPRLLSEILPVTLQTPTPFTSRPPGTSLKDQYSARWNRKTAETAPINGHAGGQRSLHTPSARAKQTQGTRHDYDAADLPRDELHTSSSSTVETSGDSRPIWREDSAARKEPLLGKGKKRSSEEFEEDELQASLAPRLSQSSFTAIDLFEDDATPPRSKRILTQTGSQRRVKGHSLDSGHRPQISATDHIFDDDLNSPSTLGRPSKHRRSGSPMMSQPQSTSTGNVSKKVITSPVLEGKRPLSRGHHRKAVADSEDEDDESEHARKVSPVKRENEHNSSLYTAKPRLVKGQGLRSEEPKNVRDHPQGIAPSQSQTMKLVATGGEASPFQRDSPTKLPPSPPSRDSSEAKPKSEISSNKHTYANKDSVQAFLSSQSNRIQAFLDGLHRTRRSMAEAVYNRMLEGTEEGNNEVASMQRQSTVLTTRIKAIDTLLTLRDEHSSLLERKEATKARIIDAIQNDLPASYYAEDGAESVIMVKRLAKIEDTISRLLGEAAIPTTSNHPSFEPGPFSPSKDSSRNHPTTLVQFTQAFPPKQVFEKGPPPLVGSGGPNPTQFILQTQAPGTLPQISGGDPGQSFSRTPARSPLKTYTSSPATKNVNAYFSPSMKAPLTSASKGQTQNQTHGAALSDSPERDFIDEYEDLFMNHMTTPIHKEYGDEYGPQDDDVDMLEVAEELENQDQRFTIDRSAGKRAVFADTSGNIVRSASAKAAPAFTTTHPPPSQFRFPWSNDVKAALTERFHLRGFRPNQLEAINATLAGKDAFVLMPTGGGKSLCYQLPSIVNTGKTRGVTVVISPLLSLMQDQVDHLMKLGIQALLLNGEVTAEHRKLVLGCLQKSEPQSFCALLYITPEMINKSQALISGLQDLYNRQRLARIVIDEAHCVSQWGHDFRPDYKMLGEVRQRFRGVPVIALTATATENVKVDVIHNLGIQNCEVFTQSFNRPNLSYEVRSKGKAKEVLDSIANTIVTHYKNQSGIIYCLSKKNCEDIAAKLQKQYKIKAHHYHAGMEPEEKKRVQKAWQRGAYRVIVATIAFGMGIDKPDVRYVIHHTIPKSLEGYYQETGRAGRDSKKSGCFMYYGYQDTSMIKRMIDDGDGSWEQKERQRQMLRMVIQFCENKSDCRRVQVLSYFNETFDKEACQGSCDNCNSNSVFETKDFTSQAIAALDLVKKIQRDNVTLLHCVDVFRGARTKKITDLHHDEVQGHGTGSDIDRGNVERLFYRLLSEDAIEEQNVVNKSGFANQYLRLGKNSYDFAKCRRKLKIQVRLSPSGNFKPGSRKLKRDTGVAASHADYPASTNVSSPILAASRRRVKQHNKRPAINEYEYRQYLPSKDENGLITSDNDADIVDHIPDDLAEFQSMSEEDEFLEATWKRLGPPITVDEKIARLNDIHQMVVEDFLENAKRQSQKLMIDKKMRGHPFTDTVLREMAINFPHNEKEMLEIDGINHDMVKFHGRTFLKLVQDAHRGYEDMMQRQEAGPQDPNHQLQNIIDISSESDYGGDDDLDGFDADEDVSEERSHHFNPSAEVDTFNQRLTQLAPAPSATRSMPQSHEPKAQGSARAGRGGTRGRGGFKKWNRKASDGFSKSKGPAGAPKGQGKSSRSRRSHVASGSVPTRRSGGTAGGGSASRGINIMPF